ncbi:MAG TPA: DUF4097 family beta strand repeat-containing protein [Pyrinomonadaceae bacterium]|nr:DUF4097 family beta strand repeat-containing protein [Pyrinomonadaceae bacterium]
MRKRFSGSLPLVALTLALFVIMPVSHARGQNEIISRETKEKIKEVAKLKEHKEFCSNNNWHNGEKVSFSELRELNLPASGKIDVDGARNGGISVKGENRSDVLVRACVQAWGSTDEAARSLASSIRINTSGVIKADGPEENFSVSYDIRVPRNTNLNLKAHNGGISIKAVDGSMDLSTLNGGISVFDAAGDVRGRTTNGGVSVALVGNGWKGSGLDLQTTNGGVNLSIPSNFAANIEAGTVNGGFSSDIPELNVTTDDQKGYGHSRARRINASLNGGGATVRVMTTNGGIRISSTDKIKAY